MLASSSSGLLLADIYGNVHVLNRDFESIKSWAAHTGGRVTHMTECKGILVTIGVSAQKTLMLPLLRGHIEVRVRLDCRADLAEVRTYA